MDEEDKTYHNKALKNNIKLFGNKHINTANAYNSLGVSFLQSKDNHKSISDAHTTYGTVSDTVRITLVSTVRF